MVDIVSIIIAVVSLIGSLVAAGFTGWISFYIDQVKRRSEAKALVHKYRDPLMLAAYDLQSRIWGIVQLDLLSYMHDETKKELLYVFTAFVIGQYLSWVYILRREAQFLRFSTDKTNKQLNHILDQLTGEFSQDMHKDENPFMLWRGQQMAIGELMTMSDNNQRYCIGFAAFSVRYNSDAAFKKWFEPIDSGITTLVEARAKGNRRANYRLRRLQHLLVDLILLLDKDGVATEKHKQTKVDPANGCICNNCPGVKSTEVEIVSPISKLPEP